MPRLAPSPPQQPLSATSPPRISPSSSTSSPCSSSGSIGDTFMSYIQKRSEPRSSPPRALRPVVNTSLTNKTQSMFDFAKVGNDKYAGMISNNSTDGAPLLAQVNKPKKAFNTDLSESFSMLNMNSNEKYSFSNSIWSKTTELPKCIGDNPFSKMGWGGEEDSSNFIPTQTLDILKDPTLNGNSNGACLQLFSNEFMQYLNQIA